MSKHVSGVAGLTVLLLLRSFPAQAQSVNRHEISLYGQGGKLPYMQYFNAGAGAGYTFFFNQHWGLSMGGDFTAAGVTIPLEDITESFAGWYQHSDGRQEIMEIQVIANGLAVSPRVTYVNTPLSLQFQTTQKHGVYASVGAKASFAQTSDYQVTAENVRTEGYFPSSGQVFGNMPNHHFVTIRNPHVSSRLQQRFSYALLCEAGSRRQLKNGLCIYAGLYLDYGLSNIAPQQIAIPMQELKNFLPDDIATNLEYMQMVEERATVDVKKEVNMVAVGVKLKLSFGIPSKKSYPPRYFLH